MLVVCADLPLPQPGSGRDLLSLQLSYIRTVCAQFYGREQHWQIPETMRNPACAGTKTGIMVGLRDTVGLGSKDEI